LAGYISQFADIVAACDPSPEARARFARRSGSEPLLFAHHEQMLAQAEIDALAIASPNFTHKQITVAAAQAGVHVFCEKAMALTVADCWEMVHACESAGVRLMVGHKRRLRPPWARMIELREELGPVVAITSCLYHDGRPYANGWWTREAQSGGTLFMAGVHVIDWMRAMCGDVATVSAMAGVQISPSFDYPDNLHVSLQFHSGAIGSLNVSLTYPSLKFRESAGPLVVCQEGSIRFVPYLDHIDLYWQRLDEEEGHLECFDDLGFDYAFGKEIGDFVRWISDGSEPCLTWREGLRCVEIMEAARRSAKEDGKVIELPLYPELEPG